jgi:single-stranded DNA-specific DHH superfamily exonuclease
MLMKKQVTEIKEILNNSGNPLFFFDNDPDGLCSFLLLQKYAKKGKGFPMKSINSNEVYFRKIREFNPDCIFILDKPVVSEDFFREIREINLPVVWIDHHETDRKSIPEFVRYYNPLLNRKKSNEPVTALCFQINHDANLAWLAVIGCISDRFFPDFYAGFRKKYPDLSANSKEAFDVFYNSQIGKIARMFSFALKDRTTNVVNMMKFLVKADSPYEVLEDSALNHSMHHRFDQIEKKYRKLLEKSVKIAEKSGNVLFFKYGGQLSISADLSNELIYRFPKKTIIVAYVSGSKVNISARGRKVRSKILKSMEGLSNATGGGHEDAAGAQIQARDLEEFMERFRKIMH